jgi:glycosyltransferase involved in cell wall biosynthesis
MISPPGPYGARLRKEGFRWEPVPMVRRSLNPLRELGLLLELVRRFRRERPQLVHGFTIKCAVYGAIAARLAGVPGRIGAVTGLGYVLASEAPGARALRPVVRGLLRLALGSQGPRLILQNPDDVLLFCNSGILDADRIRLIRGSGVDCRRFRPSAKTRGRGDPLRVVLATRLLWEKGIREYVEAARTLRREGRHVRFLLAGMPDDGNPGAVPLETVRGWADEGLIEWLGHVEDMPELLSRVDAMVLPSYYAEGVPKALIEGAASGLALVTTDMPGCREVVSHDAEGILVPPRNASALARAIARLDDDPELLRRLGNAARSRALSEFDEEAVFDRTWSVYAEVMPSLRHGPGRAGEFRLDHAPEPFLEAERSHEAG